MRPALPLLSLPLLLACGADKSAPDAADSSTPGDAADAPTWHGDVAPLLSHSCDGCHAPGGVGTPTWSTPEEAAEWAPAIADAVANRRMPPWQASDGCNDYEYDFSLAAEDVDTIVAWAEGGARLGDPETAAPLDDPFSAPELARVDLELRMPEAYPPSPYEGTDDYRCFLLEWPYEEDVWVTGYEVLPGDLQTVHHVIPFIIEPGAKDTFLALDEAEDGAGYTCYGSPGGGLSALANMRWLGAWAPGSGAAALPEGKGIKIRPGSLIAYQVHYNLAATDAPAPDLSGLALQVETEAQGWADIQPWTDVAWVAGAGMQIPANTDGVEHQFSYEVSGSDGEFTFHSASVHMHKLGQKARMWIDHADGSQTCLVDYQDYDFNWQRGYRFTDPITVGPGDTVQLTCTWDNPTDQDVKWGDGTGDEMCLGVSLLTE
jgi:hypothetical protein